MLKVKKNESNLNKTKAFIIIFALTFVISLFMEINALAQAKIFKLNNASITEMSTGVSGNISNFTDEEVTNNITFHKLNDYAKLKLELTSKVNREITILGITDDNSNSYITYEYDKHENEKISSNGTLNFIVKAVYKNTVTDTSKRNQTNNVTLTIKYLDNGEEKTNKITVNPQTGDNIRYSFILLIISSTGLIVCIVLYKKKKISRLSVLILIGLVLSPMIVKAATVAYNITLKSNVGLYDKLIVTFDDGSSKTTKTVEYGKTVDSLPVPTKTGYTLTKWVNEDDTTFDITEAINEDKTVKAVWTINSYTITFDTDGGSIINPITQNYNTDITPPASPIKNGFIFDGWEPELPSKMPAQNMTVKAKWVEDDSQIICKRAKSLSEEICQISGTSTEGCRGDKYSYGDPIVYGSIVLSNELSSGNALDCNVDGTGYNQRFYYLRTLNGNAVLISNRNFEGDNGQGNNNNYIYNEAHSKLPRKLDQWKNVPITFTNSGDDTVYAARFVTMDDLKAATGSNDLTVNNSFNSPYNYVFENTSYANVADPEYRSTVWLEQEGSNRYRYHKQDRNIVPLTTSNFDTSKNGVRPVIEVPLDKINLSINDNEATLVFISLGGTSYDLRTYEKGSTVNELPEPVREGFDFAGWYTEDTYENEFKNGDVINNHTILYAKWLLNNATVEYNNTGYTSFSSAINQVKNSNEAEIKLLKNTSEKITIPSSKNIKIDLNGHTITNDGDNQIIYNQGTVTVKNGTITTTAETKAAFDNNTNNYGTIENVTINANGNRSAVYNSKGTVTITGGSYLSTTNDLRPTVMNINTSSTMNIVDATIISNDKNAVDNNKGILTIGKNDTNINASTPVIIGGSYGLASNADVQMYDGIIKGKLAPVYNGNASTSNDPITYSGGSVNNNRIIASETGYIKATGTDGEYHTLYLIHE